MIDVEVGGRRYAEMNVDGGAVVQTFLYPPNVGLRVDLRSPEHARERHAYIIRNGRLDPDWASVDRRFVTIVGRAISTMIHYSGYNDILRIYNTTKRDGVDYNLAYIETDFSEIEHEQFDPGYLRALFAYGYDKGRRGSVGTRRRLSCGRHPHRSAVAPLFSVDLNQSGICQLQERIRLLRGTRSHAEGASRSAPHPRRQRQEHRQKPGLCMSIHLVRGVVVVSAMALALPPPKHSPSRSWCRLHRLR